jgi:hypothetical protein
MNELDTFGKDLMRRATGDLFLDSESAVTFELGPGAGNATIDGTIADIVAVKIESRLPEQVRGGLVDLMLHPCTKKLLVLLPVFLGNPTTAVAHAEVILGRFLEPNTFRVVYATNDVLASILAIRSALADLGVSFPPTG